MNGFASLIVEGIPGIGKSTLIDALLRRHVEASGPRRLRTVVHLAQTHTYGPLAHAEDARTLTVAQNLRHLDAIVAMLEWLHAGVRDRRRPYAFVLLDTLHLTHTLRPGIVTWDDVASFDARLAAIGCRLILLVGSEETIRRRAIGERVGTQFLREYAVKFGRTADELTTHFVHEQAAFVAMADASAMASLTLKSDAESDRNLELAYAFWRGT